ncbi:MAG: thioredoxin domain-containing protein [Holosporaceae bacterium]|nr:thioredoxin domain-containing protein [Holosporaceae bacterium]
MNFPDALWLFLLFVGNLAEGRGPAKAKNQTIRALLKPSNFEEFSGVTEAQNRSVLEVREDSSTGTTQKLPKERRLRKSSINKTEKSDGEEESFLEKLKKMSIPNELALPEVVIGSPTAPNTVIVYSSFTCSHCRDFHEKELPKFQKQYVDTGKARVYLRAYLDDLGALEAASLVRCFGGNSSKKIHDLTIKLFSLQKKWMESKDPKQFLRNIFLGYKYSAKQIDKCLADIKISAGLMKEQQRATDKLKISLIPAFIINGKTHQGILTCEQIASMF